MGKTDIDWGGITDAWAKILFTEPMSFTEHFSANCTTHLRAFIFNHHQKFGVCRGSISVKNDTDVHVLAVSKDSCTSSDNTHDSLRWVSEKCVNLVATQYFSANFKSYRCSSHDNTTII